VIAKGQPSPPYRKKNSPEQVGAVKKNGGTDGQKKMPPVIQTAFSKVCNRG